MSEPPRSVKIGDDERGGWSSDRPRRAGQAERPPRKADVSVRGRVLAPTDRMRYSPGSLVLIACADRALRDRFTARVIEEQSAVLSLDKVRTLLQGRVPAGELEAKAQALLDAAATKRFVAGQSVVIPLEALAADERERYVRLAHAHRRARHLVLVEAGKDSVADEDRAALTELRTALDAGELGLEGFMTSLRLGGRMVDELKRIVFAPPPADD
jgi:predicted kinase